MNLAAHEQRLAAETGTTVAAVRSVTNASARRLVDRARLAERRCPGEHDWLEVVLACNAATNPHARAIIEQRARALAAEPQP